MLVDPKRGSCFCCCMGFHDLNRFMDPSDIYLGEIKESWDLWLRCLGERSFLNFWGLIIWQIMAIYRQLYQQEGFNLKLKLPSFYLLMHSEKQILPFHVCVAPLHSNTRSIQYQKDSEV